ncbi:MAG: substrate-binding domain-containing protein [Deltaproteobacteria bacterium]|nr:substrate-binding domain-containing protein [Deltaproteobacteria bacterium]
MRLLRVMLGAGLALALAGAAHAAPKQSVRLATTSALVDTGLLAYLLPKFTADTGIEVQVLAVDATRAFELGKRGEADALLVDDRAGEDFFLSQRHATERREVMYVEYLVAGPRNDPAELGDGASAPGAFKAFSERQQAFVSRGDGSGTVALEKRLWNQAGRVPDVGAGTWYFSANASMAKTLALAGEKRAYVLVDKPTWLREKNHYGLIELVDGGVQLQNGFGVLVVNDLKHKTARYAPAKKLADWLTGTQGRTLIPKFKIAEKFPYMVR